MQQTVHISEVLAKLSPLAAAAGYRITLNLLPPAGRTYAQEYELRTHRQLIAAGLRPRGSKPTFMQPAAADKDSWPFG